MAMNEPVDRQAWERFPSSRVRWLATRYANVDGIPFAMPVGARQSPAIFAAFTIDPDAAAAILPGQELHPARILRRGILVVTVVDYMDTTIGRYIEFCIGIAVTRGRSPAIPLLPMLLQPLFGTAVYIYDLPVSTEISVKGGLGIFGMPKRQANLDFIVGADTLSSQYDLDGQLAMRIDLPRPGRAWLPMRIRGAGYGSFRGLLAKSYINVRGGLALSLSGERVRLLVGDHPRMDPIKKLDISPKPLAWGFVPEVEGVLDDHVETWYLTGNAPPGPAAVGTRDVVDLTLDQTWLTPPDRVRSDRMMQELSPTERVGRRPAPAG
jgi:hypothetical protein